MLHNTSEDLFSLCISFLLLVLGVALAIALIGTSGTFARNLFRGTPIVYPCSSYPCLNR